MSQSPSSLGAGEAFSVPPLTCSCLNGVRYQRRADVETKISAMVQMGQSSWLQEADELPAEVLVYLIRSVADKDVGLAGDLIHKLSRRIQSVTRRWARGFSKEDTEDIVQTVTTQIIELILAATPSRQSEFLEIAFDKKVKGKTLNEVANVKAQQVEVSLTAQEDEHLDIPDTRPGPFQTVLTKDNLHLLRRARAAFRDPRHYEVLLLRFGHDWPIDSVDENEPTLAKRYGKTPRQIQNWINNGLETLRNALGIQL